MIERRDVSQNAVIPLPRMPVSHRAILNVWREACRHIEIAESAESIEQQLTSWLTLQRLYLRRVDPVSGDLTTLAVAPDEPDRPASEDRRSLSPADRDQILRWCVSDRILRRGKRLTGTLGLLLPHELDEDLLAVPLAIRGEPLGGLILVAKAGRTFDDEAVDLATALGEPFSVAIDNDRRLQEIRALREAAVADRGALLRRLGRTDLGETVVGEQTGLRHVLERVDLVAASDAPVLILGETGTGKEVISRAIHTRSRRHDGPFIRVNCGAIPAELIDSQLFGHERGSFTGADQSREGWFERANGGTLFLDEIGELPLEAQVRFLRVLQDGFIERVGSTRPIHVDVRIVAATHRDLATMVGQRTFREDLWYRLAVFPLWLPPLRDRRDDIPALAAHFAERAATRFGLPHVAPSEDDLAALATYDWPGNIRELGAVIDRAAILGNGVTLEVAKALGFGAEASARRSYEAFPPGATAPGLPAASRASHPSAGTATPTEAGQSATNRARSVVPLDEAIRQHIASALTLCRGQVEGRRGAAALLKVNPHTLRAKMRKLGIDWSQFRDDQSWE